MAFNPNEFVEFQAPKRRYQDELREQVLRRHHYREVIEGMPGGENTVIHLIPSGDTLEELLVAGACQTPLKSNPGEKFWPFHGSVGMGEERTERPEEIRGGRSSRMGCCRARHSVGRPDYSFQCLNISLNIFLQGRKPCAPHKVLFCLKNMKHIFLIEIY